MKNIHKLLFAMAVMLISGPVSLQAQTSGGFLRPYSELVPLKNITIIRLICKLEDYGF